MNLNLPPESADVPPPPPPASTPPALPPVLPPIDSVTSPEPPAEGPWGFWATVGFCLLIAVVVIVVQTGAVIGLVFIQGHRPSDIQSNGDALVWITLLSTPIAATMCWIFAELRRHHSGISPAQYLGFKRVEPRTLIKCLLAGMALVAAGDGMALVTGKAVVPDWMTRVYGSASSPALLWFVIIVVGPVGEEILFRGFALPGIAQSFVGGAGAVTLTAAAWAVIHIQYEISGVVTIFIVGLLLGMVRLVTGSIVPCLAMHGLQNLIATIQVLVVSNR